MLNTTAIAQLRGSKNLLAYSAGSDSSALFAMLLDEEIEFDIAHVNYNTRASSADEYHHAKELATKYGKICHTLESKKIEKNFEKNARDIRYTFFEKIIQEHHYKNLITAHQLDDRLEWLLMQLCRGVGAVELSSMRAVQHREQYAVVRPLLECSKSEVLHYLSSKQICYFEDESNSNTRFKRNWFREHISSKLMSRYSANILKSFRLLEQDSKALLDANLEYQVVRDAIIIKPHHNQRATISLIDSWLKSIGIKMSYSERELLKTSTDVAIGREYTYSSSSDLIVVAPLQKATMPKEFKELCRRSNIGKSSRPWLYNNRDILHEVIAFLPKQKSKM